MRIPAATGCLLLSWAVLRASPAAAQYDDPADESQDRFWMRALVDLRAARGPAAPSWTDGGPGKTRFGGRATADGFERVTRIALANLAIEAGAALPADWRAAIQLNVQEDIAGDYEPWIVEATLRREWGAAAAGHSFQAGVMTIPLALEHTGPAWTPERTLSASAIGAWLWEDWSLAGIEAEWWRAPEGGMRLGLLAGAGFGPDLFGRVLALRGWTLGDAVGGIPGDLPLPNGTRSDIFDERDDRPSAHALVTVGDSRELATLTVGYVDNRGDEDEPGVWHTRLATVGLTLRPHPSVDVIAQAVEGEARVGDLTNDSDFDAFYGLVSYRYRAHRFTLRYDDFRVEDVDGGNPTSERGDALTAAWMLELGLRHRLAFEYVWMDSLRPDDAPADLASDGWQFAYRYRY
jgi:hypothetical protein